MTKPESDIVRYRVGRACETLEEARLLLGAGHVNAYVNRLYYACYYAVSALLKCEGRDPSTHRGVSLLFASDWVKTGRVPIESSRFYRKLFDSRQEGDYVDLVHFKESDVGPWLSQATEFVGLITRLIDEIIGKPFADGPD